MNHSTLSDDDDNESAVCTFTSNQINIDF